MFGRQTDTIAYFFDRFSDFHWLCLYYFGFSDETTWSFLWEGWKRARLNFNRFIPSNILICLQILGIDGTKSIIFIRTILLLVKRVWRMRLLLFFFILLLFCFCKINSNFKTQMQFFLFRSYFFYPLFLYFSLFFFYNLFDRHINALLLFLLMLRIKSC